MAAGLRNKASVARPRTRKGKDSTPTPSEYSDSELGEEDNELDEVRDNVREVDSWKSELEDDEADDAPDDVDNSTLTWNVDVDLSRGRWEDVGVLRVDPRSKNGSVPDDIPPAFLMPGYRDDALLNMFLFYFPLRLITEIVTATNANAATIAWPSHKPWKHLKVGEWMRWLGLWVLMTLYPINGSRRLYWRGSLAFGRYMPERRFEAILRSFTLPQYTRDDAE